MMGKGPIAEYDGTNLRLELPQTFMADSLRVERGNYKSILRARKDVPDGIRTLIFRLFEAGVITKCTVSYGRKINFALARNVGGRELLDVGRLQAFSKAFKKITDKEIPVTQMPEGKVRSRSGSGGGGFGALVDMIGDALTRPATVLNIMTWRD